MKTLKEMALEVEQVNREKGWYDDDRTFGELLALLHSEVSEALEAYRQWGLEDQTPKPFDDDVMRNLAKYDVVPKPEGVGSELADVLIRLLDDALRWGIDLDDEVAKLGPGGYEMPESFGDQLNALHDRISYVSMVNAQKFPFLSYPPRALAQVLVFLRQLSDVNGIDLDAEYERKIAYNRTRPYRHGGKKL